MKWLLSSLVAVVVLGAVVQLSCVAGERRAAAGSMPPSLFTDALEPELPIASEVKPVEPWGNPTLTR